MTARRRRKTESIDSVVLATGIGPDASAAIRDAALAAAGAGRPLLVDLSAAPALDGAALAALLAASRVIPCAVAASAALESSLQEWSLAERLDIFGSEPDARAHLERTV